MQEVQRGVLAGDAKALEDLYTRNKGLLYKLSRIYWGACIRDRAIDQDDLIQAGYIGLVAAIKKWDPERGEWLGHAAGYVRNEMRRTLGINTSRIRAEHGAVSLDEVIPGAEDGTGLTRLDLLEDADAVPVDEAIMVDDLQREVRTAVQEIKDKRRRDVVWANDIEGRTYQEIGQDLGMSSARVGQLRNSGHRDLKRSVRMYRLAREYALDQRTRFHAHKGVNAFMHDWTSTTEAAAIWRIEHGPRGLESFERTGE